MVGFADAEHAVAPPDQFRPAVIEVPGGLFEGELARVNRHLAGAPRVVVYDEDVTVTAFVQLTPHLVLEVRDVDATVHVELRRLTEDELRTAIRDEHAWEPVVGPNPFGVPVDDAGCVMPTPRAAARAPRPRPRASARRP